MELQLSALYEDCCHTHVHDDMWKLSATDEKGFTDSIESMVERVWKEKGLPEGDIDKSVVAEFAKRLWSGVEKGYGKKLTDVDFTTPDYKMLAALQKDVWQFSAAKNYAQLRALTNALIGGDGKLRSYKDFKLEAFEINDKHVNQWLQTEYDLAVSGSQMAAKWVYIKEQADTLPLLEFDAVIDGRTSDLCRNLNKTILPIDDPFWKTYYPPNHFKCRSTVWQRQKGNITPPDKVPNADIPPMFRVNLAEQGLVFPPKHAYYDGLPKEVMSFGDANYKLDTSRFDRKGHVYESGLAFDPAKKFDKRYFTEYKMRQTVADSLANHFDNDIFICPDFTTPEDDFRYHYFYSGIIPFNQPDIHFNNEYWELKSYEDKFEYSKITKMLRRGKKQSENIVMKINEPANIDNIKKRVTGYLNQNKSAKIKKVIVVDYKNNIHPIK